MIKALILFFLPIALFATEKNIAWEQYTDFQIEEYRQMRDLRERKQDLDHLFAAKRAIVDGEVQLAMHYLQRIDHRGKAIGLIKKRYQALINFIGNNYSQVIDILNDSKFYDVTTYPEICMMKVISLMALKRDTELKSEFSSCSAMLATHAVTEFEWPTTLYQSYKKEKYILDATDLTMRVNAISNKEDAALWLKKALFTNREDKMAHLLSEIPGEAYQSHRVRELIGMVYYRLGDYPKAVEFVEDIHTPNAANIRGNIHFSRGEYELAWGHFKLALKYKDDSVNAIERALPLTWMLGQWNSGLEVLSKSMGDYVDLIKKMALNTAFQVRLENFKRASRQMEQLKDLYQGEIPGPASSMYSYVSLRNGDRENYNKYALESCHKKDGLNCWMVFASIYWENMPRTILRDEPIIEQSKIDSFNQLKTETINAQIDETEIVDQRDIEELDNEEIVLKVN